MDIGNRIKYIRKQKNLTLQQLSDMTKLSTGYLSNLERNLNSPTLINLQQICEALKINMPDLLNALPQNKISVKKEDRREVFQTKSNVKYELTTEGKKRMKGVCMTISSGKEFEEISWGHHSDEFGVIVKGTLEIEMTGIKYVLNEGDSIYIYAHSPHKYRNIGTEDCVSYWTFIDDDMNSNDMTENQ